MTMPELLLCAFATVCLLAAAVPQVRARRRHILGPLALHAGASDDWAADLAEMLADGIGSAAAR